MKINSLENIEKFPVNMQDAIGVSKQIPISSIDGTPSFSFRVFTIESKGNTPYHQHPYEHLNYIIEGNGILVDKDGNEKKLNKGDFAIVDPNEKRQFKNDSDANFVMICAVPKEFE